MTLALSSLLLHLNAQQNHPTILKRIQNFILIARKNKVLQLIQGNKCGIASIRWQKKTQFYNKMRRLNLVDSFLEFKHLQVHRCPKITKEPKIGIVLIIMKRLEIMMTEFLTCIIYKHYIFKNLSRDNQNLFLKENIKIFIQILRILSKPLKIITIQFHS